MNGKPSFILTQMCNIANGKCNEEVLRSLFMEQLPAFHLQILATVTTKTLTELVQLADKITDEMQLQRNSEQQVASVAVSEGSNSELISKIDAIATKLENLKQKMNNSNRGRGRSQNRQRSNGRNQFRSNSRSNQSQNRSRNERQQGTCWYHWKFADKCIPSKCTAPCNWTQKENSGKE